MRIVTAEPLTPAAIDMIEARGIAAETVAHLGHIVASITTDKGARGLGFRHRVDGDKRDHWACRGISHKGFWQTSGTKRRLWNNEIFDKKPAEVIITEGHVDGLSLMAVGFENVSSVPDGAPEFEIEGPTTKFEYLDPIDWNAIPSVILAVDNDWPGRTLREELARRIGRSRCKFVNWPRGCKDANDVLMQHGPEALTAAISSARYMPMPGLLTLRDIPLASPEAPWSTGVKGLDNIWKPSPKRMTVLTGIPGMGKTTWLCDVIVSLVEENGIAVAIASFEDDIRISLVPRLIQRICRKPLEQCNIADELKAERWIEKYIVFIQPPEHDGDEVADVHWFQERATAAALQKNCKLIICDPFNEIDHTSRPADVNVTEYTGVMLKRLRQGAKREDYHLIIAAHPKKMHKGSDGNPAMPSGYDIADCYSDDTEALTKRGWLTHDRITLDDQVMCFDLDSNTVDWRTPSRIVNHAYTGDMVRFNGYGFDMLVTPNHRMVVKPAWNDPVGSQRETGIGRPTKWQKDQWQFTTADEIASLKSRFKIPKGAYVLEADAPATVTIRGHTFPAHEFMELVGWFVAEGSFVSSGATLSQAVGKKADRIDMLLDACGIEPTRRVTDYKRGVQPIVIWYFGARNYRALVDWFERKCGRGESNKKVPYAVWSMDPSLKASFLNGYIAGDGHAPDDRDGRSATTTSPKLYDDLMRLAVEMGIPVCGHKRKHNGNPKHSPSWQVNLGREKRQQVGLESVRHASKESYDGHVWCLTVPTGAYVTRRNGKVAISGNSAHWVNKPDNGLTIHRLDGRLVKLASWKCRREGVIGSKGKACFSFDPETGMYTFDIIETQRPDD